MQITLWRIIIIIIIILKSFLNAYGLILNIFKLKTLLKDFKPTDHLLLTGDPAIIGVVCSLVSDITNGRFNLLKWDRQEKRYYPIEIDLYGTGAKNDD